MKHSRNLFTLIILASTRLGTPSEWRVMECFHMFKSILFALFGAFLGLPATAQTGAATSGVSQERTPVYGGGGFAVSSLLSEANSFEWKLDQQASDLPEAALSTVVTVRNSEAVFVYAGADYQSLLDPIAKLKITGADNDSDLERFAHNFTTEAGQNRVTVQLRNDGKLALRYSLRDETSNKYKQTARYVYVADSKWSDGDASSVGTVDTDRVETLAPN